MAAEQRVAAPDRSGKGLGQLSLAASPTSKLALLGVLQRHCSDAALATGAAGEAHQRRSGFPPLELLPHLIVDKQFGRPPISWSQVVVVVVAVRNRRLCTDFSRAPAHRRSCGGRLDEIEERLLEVFG